MAVTISGSAGVTTNSGAVYNSIQSATAQASTSGTSIDFTSIPSWVKRITVMFNGVSTSGTSAIQIRIGTSSGVETSAYSGITIGIGVGGSVAPSALSSGFQICDAAVAAAAATWNGHAVINLLTATTNTFTCVGGFGRGDSAITGIVNGSKSLSGTLDRVRITTVGGTDTFDAGSINILYE